MDQFNSSISTEPQMLQSTQNIENYSTGSATHPRQGSTAIWRGLNCEEAASTMTPISEPSPRLAVMTLRLESVQYMTGSPTDNTARSYGRTCMSTCDSRNMSTVICQCHTHTHTHTCWTSSAITQQWHIWRYCQSETPETPTVTDTLVQLATIQTNAEPTNHHHHHHYLPCIFLTRLDHASSDVMVLCLELFSSVFIFHVMDFHSDHHLSTL